MIRSILATVVPSLFAVAQMADAATATQAETPAPTPVPPGHKEFAFHFRTEKVRNEAGEVIGEGRKLPEFKAILPVPSDEDLINFIAAGGKESKFLREVVEDAIKQAARGQINEWRENNPEGTPTMDVLDQNKLTFTYIANLEPKDRAAPEYPEEQWNTFFEDYKNTLVASGKEPQRVAKHIVLFKSQFRTCKFDKPALTVLRDNLNLYAAKTENMEDNADIYQVLINKVNKYLNAEEKNLVAAL